MPTLSDNAFKRTREAVLYVESTRAPGKEVGGQTAPFESNAVFAAEITSLQADTISVERLNADGEKFGGMVPVAKPFSQRGERYYPGEIGDHILVYSVTYTGVDQVKFITETRLPNPKKDGLFYVLENGDGYIEWTNSADCSEVVE